MEGEDKKKEKKFYYDEIFERQTSLKEEEEKKEKPEKNDRFNWKEKVLAFLALLIGFCIGICVVSFYIHK